MGESNATVPQTEPQDGNQNNGPMEVDEIFSPGDNGIYTAQMPVLPRPETVHKRKPRSNTDETDNVEKEPSCSFFNPSETEEIIEASSDPAPSPVCWPSRSSYLQKECDALFLAVDYHLKEKMEEILTGHEGEWATYVFIHVSVTVILLSSLSFSSRLNFTVKFESIKNAL